MPASANAVPQIAKKITAPNTDFMEMLRCSYGSALDGNNIIRRESRSKRI